MIHPDTELRIEDPDMGLGVFATTHIPRGTVLWVRDVLDVVLTRREVAELGAMLRASVHRLGYRDARGRWIVCWDGGKHVNHSCDPTMRGVCHDAMIAVRDVAPGEELTCDYAECNLSSPLTCECGASTCRGVISVTDDSDAWALWGRDVSEVLRLAQRVRQPLVSACVDVRLRSIIDGTVPMPELSTVALRAP